MTASFPPYCFYRYSFKTILWPVKVVGEPYCLQPPRSQYEIKGLPGQQPIAIQSRRDGDIVSYVTCKDPPNLRGSRRIFETLKMVGD
jgi:hypothetical protein